MGPKHRSGVHKPGAARKSGRNQPGTRDRRGETAAGKQRSAAKAAADKEAEMQQTLAHARDANKDKDARLKQVSEQLTRDQKELAWERARRIHLEGDVEELQYALKEVQRERCAAKALPIGGRQRVRPW